MAAGAGDRNRGQRDRGGARALAGGGGSLPQDAEQVDTLPAIWARVAARVPARQVKLRGRRPKGRCWFPMPR